MRLYQIGLGGYSEYAYLASRDRMCYARAASVMFQLPPPLGADPEWEVILVEAHPAAFCQTIDSVRAQLPDAMERIRWVLGAVWADATGALPFTINETLGVHDGWSQISDDMEDYTPHRVPALLGVPTMQIDIAVISVLELLERYGEPDYVVLDCENAEVRLLMEFLRLAPNCTAYQVETHSAADAERVRTLLKQANYHIVKSVKMRYNRTEVQAVKDSSSGEL